MTVKYQELGYSLPTVTAKAAADKAISILEHISTEDESCLFYAIQPSNILALAGLRAESPYNEFEPDFSRKRQKLLDEILRSHGCFIKYAKVPYDDDTRQIFSIMCIAAWLQLPAHYEIVKTSFKPPLKPGDPIDFILWSEGFQFQLVKMMENETLPKKWLLHWWSPHHIRFGMLLGYPGPAISYLCWSEAEFAQGKKPTKGLESKEPFRGAYLGTSTTYDFAKSMANDQIIKKHQALWSEVLTQVYDAFPRSRLAKMPDFVAEYKRYKKYDGDDRPDEI